MTYICTNCGHKQDRKYIKAMIKAGFGVHHLECGACGQQTIKIKESK
jgi:transcription elongation factor Elf1